MEYNIKRPHLCCTAEGILMIFPNKPVRCAHFNDPNYLFWGSDFLFNNQEVIILAEPIPDVNCDITWNDDPIELSLDFDDLKKYGKVGTEIFCLEYE